MRPSVFWIAGLLLWGCSLPAKSEAVEIAPGIHVTRTTYDVPLNEAPFFNFQEKTEAQVKVDEDFVAEVLGQVPDRARAARAASDRGWDYIQQGDFVSAAKRFNQAFLLDPNDSKLYYGFAVVVASRFEDYDFADELFRLAALRNDPSPTLKTDHARMFLVAGRPADALPLAEAAVRENPPSAIPYIHLGWARHLTGDSAGACAAVTGLATPDLQSQQQHIIRLRQTAGCD